LCQIDKKWYVQINFFYCNLTFFAKKSFWILIYIPFLFYETGVLLVSELEEISKMTIYPQIMEFPEQIEFALKTKIGNLPKASKVCICGIGASSIAGDIMTDYADGFSNLPIPVVRSMELPKWVDDDTLVIVISYSGNTRETLHMYDLAMNRRSKIICITSGGELTDKCTADKNVLVKVPLKTSSRGSLGYLLGSLAVIFEEMGICNGRTELYNMLDGLKDFRNSLMKDDKNKALAIAKTVQDRIPVIYGLVNIRSSTIRWKTQINENSKMIAFCGMLPEFNHNEIIGWTEDGGAENFLPIVLYDEAASDLMKVIMDSTIEIFRECGFDPFILRLKCESNMEKNLKFIMTGDFVSLFLAYFRGVDPCSIQTVTKVKEHVDLSEENRANKH